MDYHGLNNTSIMKVRLEPRFGAGGTFVPIVSSPVLAVDISEE